MVYINNDCCRPFSSEGFGNTGINPTPNFSRRTAEVDLGIVSELPVHRPFSVMVAQPEVLKMGVAAFSVGSAGRKLPVDASNCTLRQLEAIVS